MRTTSHLSDDILVQLLKEDSQDAITEIYNRYWLKLLTVATNRLGNEEEAKECVQDIFYSLWRRRNVLDLKYSLSTYLSVAVKYSVIDLMDKHYRLQKRMKNASLLYEEDLSPAADEKLLEKELLKKIEDSVQQLPEKCQEVFRLSREQGLTDRQISERLEISENTVRVHLKKAFRDIRSNLTTILPTAILTVMNSDIFNHPRL